MWNEFLIFSKWLETTHLSHLMAGGWKWGWRACETLHFIGLSMLLGCIGVVDLRMLGVGKSMPGAPVHKLVPWAVAGFLINAITGKATRQIFLKQFRDVQFAGEACYQAVVEAVEEATVNTLVANDDMVGRDGHRSPALPRDRVAAVFADR